MKLLIILLLGFMVSAQKTVAVSLISDWKIIEYTDYIYFSWDFKNANYGNRASNGKSIAELNITSKEQLLSLTDALYMFSAYLKRGYYYRYGCYSLENPISNDYLYLYDNDGCLLKLTKSQAKKIALEIRKYVELLKEN